LALAASSKYPDPPKSIREAVLKASSEERHAIQMKIPKADLNEYQQRGAILLYILVSHQCRVDDHDSWGATALYMAVEIGNKDMVRELLRFGANPNTKTAAYFDGPGDITPLHRASSSRILLELLLTHGADGNAKDSDGNLPADWVSLDEDRLFDLTKTLDGWKLTPRRGK